MAAIEIIDLIQRPELADAAADYLASKWAVPRQAYVDSIAESLVAPDALPRWCLLLEGGAIIGSYGLIQNDYIDRTDLWPWLCALYVEPPHRDRGLGSRLLADGKARAARLGYPKLYLATDHIGYYERYGFVHIGSGRHPDGDTSRVYQADTGV